MKATLQQNGRDPQQDGDDKLFPVVVDQQMVSAKVHGVKRVTRSRVVLHYRWLDWEPKATVCLEDVYGRRAYNRSPPHRPIRSSLYSPGLEYVQSTASTNQSAPFSSRPGVQPVSSAANHIARLFLQALKHIRKHAGGGGAGRSGGGCWPCGKKGGIGDGGSGDAGAEDAALLTASIEARKTAQVKEELLCEDATSFACDPRLVMKLSDIAQEQACMHYSTVQYNPSASFVRPIVGALHSQYVPSRQPTNQPPHRPIHHQSTAPFFFMLLLLLQSKLRAAVLANDDVSKVVIAPVNRNIRTVRVEPLRTRMQAFNEVLMFFEPSVPFDVPFEYITSVISAHEQFHTWKQRLLVEKLAAGLDRVQNKSGISQAWRRR